MTPLKALDERGPRRPERCHIDLMSKEEFTPILETTPQECIDLMFDCISEEVSHGGERRDVIETILRLVRV